MTRHYPKPNQPSNTASLQGQGRSLTPFTLTAFHITGHTNPRLAEALHSILTTPLHKVKTRPHAGPISGSIRNIEDDEDSSVVNSIQWRKMTNVDEEASSLGHTTKAGKLNFVYDNKQETTKESFPGSSQAIVNNKNAISSIVLTNNEIQDFDVDKNLRFILNLLRSTTPWVTSLNMAHFSTHHGSIYCKICSTIGIY